MKMHPYSYSVLRYVHDTTSGEFINVGVAIYSKENGFAKIICRHTHGRLSRFFPGMRADYFKTLMKSVQLSFNELGDKLKSELIFKNYQSVLDIAKQILPQDDSALQWSPIGVGRAKDLELAHQNLFNRLIMRYEEKVTNEKRSEEDVWRSFKLALEANQILHHFEPKKITTADDEIEFRHTWQNGVLHCLEPISFDLSSADSIRDKAHKWLGRITSVKGATDKFKMYFLVGSPQEEDLSNAYQKALNILAKVPVEKRIFQEQEAGELYQILAQEIERHNQGCVSC